MINRVSGLASGIDTDELIKKMMAAQRAPVDKLSQQKISLEWKREAYLDMNTKVYDFRNTKMFNYRMQGTWLSSKVDISGNQSAITAKANNSAVQGSYTIKVDQLAKAASDQSSDDIRSDKTFDPAKPLATEGIKLNPNFNSADNEMIINGKIIEFDPNVDSLNSIIAKINKESTVNAFYDKETGKLAFVSKQTGLVNNVHDAASSGGKYITFEGSFITDILKVKTDTDTGGTPNPNAAVNAKLTINGIETSRTSNTFELNGTSITMNQAGGEATTLKVSHDTDKIVETVKSFINDYNEMMKWAQEKSSEKRYRDFHPLIEEQKNAMKENEVELWEKKAKSGILRNDDVLTSVISSVRSAASSFVDTGSKFNSLGAIGIATGQYTEKGKLYLEDEAKLIEAINADPEAIMKLFAGKSSVSTSSNEVGLAERIYNDLDKVLQEITRINGAAGLQADYKDESVFGKQMSRIKTQIDDREDRLAMIENRYYRQFTAMENAINRLNAQSTQLLSQFT